MTEVEMNQTNLAVANFVEVVDRAMSTAVDQGLSYDTLITTLEAITAQVRNEKALLDLDWTIT